MEMPKRNHTTDCIHLAFAYALLQVTIISDAAWWGYLAVAGSLYYFYHIGYREYIWMKFAREYRVAKSSAKSEKMFQDYAELLFWGVTYISTSTYFHKMSDVDRRTVQTIFSKYGIDPDKFPDRISEPKTEPAAATSTDNPWKK